MKVKNLNQLFAEFKKYREAKKNVANEKNFYDYVSSGSRFLQSQSETAETSLIESE
jgi:hypothetical protein